MEQEEINKLGISDQVISLEASNDHYAHWLSMLQQGQRECLVFSRFLDGQLYNQSEFLQAMREFTIRHNMTEIKILVKDMDPIVKAGHRILELSRALSSHIHIRVIHPDYSHHNEAFTIIDGRGVIYRKLSDRYEGIANYNDPIQGRDLGRFFKEVWEHSHSSQDTKRLFI